MERRLARIDVLLLLSGLAEDLSRMTLERLSPHRRAVMPSPSSDIRRSRRPPCFRIDLDALAPA